jgi:hypothetical protein
LWLPQLARACCPCWGTTSSPAAAKQSVENTRRRRKSTPRSTGPS